MKTNENIKLITVGKFLGGLRKYEEEHWDLSIIAWAQDDLTLGVVGAGKDEDGDLRIEVEAVEEELEGIWTVADVVESLESCDKKKQVYMAGHGLYFAIDNKGGIFTEGDDDMSLGCDVTVFGEYEEEEPPGIFTEEERRQREEWAKKKARREKWVFTIEGITILLCIPLTAYGLYYNIAALVKHSMPVWECVFYILFLGFLLWICIDNLFFPNHRD